MYRFQVFTINSVGIGMIGLRMDTVGSVCLSQIGTVGLNLAVGRLGDPCKTVFRDFLLIVPIVSVTATADYHLLTCIVSTYFTT